MKLDKKAFGFAAGIIWGVYVAIATALSLISGYARSFLAILADIYPAYRVSSIGVIVGAIYGFIDGFISGYILAWIYNKFSKSESKSEIGGQSR